jgi:hypothetical protein
MQCKAFVVQVDSIPSIFLFLFNLLFGPLERLACFLLGFLLRAANDNHNVSKLAKD